MANRAIYDHRGSVLKELITHDHEPEGTLHVRTAQDLEPVLDLAKKMRVEHAQVGHRMSKQMVPVAEVPMIIYEQAVREGWSEDPAAWRRWLNDPQNRPFRVTEGRV